MHGFHGGRMRHRCGFANPDTHSCTDRHPDGHAHADTNCDAYPNANSNADACANPDTHSGADRRDYVPADPNAHTRCGGDGTGATMHRRRTRWRRDHLARPRSRRRGRRLRRSSDEYVGRKAVLHARHARSANGVRRRDHRRQWGGVGTGSEHRPVPTRGRWRPDLHHCRVEQLVSERTHAARDDRSGATRRSGSCRSQHGWPHTPAVVRFVRRTVRCYGDALASDLPMTPPERAAETQPRFR